VYGLVEINAECSESQIKFTWSPLTSLVETGGTPILSYDIEWDQGFQGQVWKHLAGYSFDYTQTSYTATANIIKGTTYQVHVRAKNYWGFGPFSSTITIKASTVPRKMATVTTSVD
jgi:hypothetical protein